jgi:hypothetical protein
VDLDRTSLSLGGLIPVTIREAFPATGPDSTRYNDRVFLRARSRSFGVQAVLPVSFILVGLITAGVL